MTYLLCGVALCISPVLFAATEGENIPEMEFLEYLGMWDETDEDWQLLDDDTVAENDKRSDPVLEGEESTEKKDEG